MYILYIHFFNLFFFAHEAATQSKKLSNPLLGCNPPVEEYCYIDLEIISGDNKTAQMAIGKAIGQHVV